MSKMQNFMVCVFLGFALIGLVATTVLFAAAISECGTVAYTNKLFGINWEKIPETHCVAQKGGAA